MTTISNLPKPGILTGLERIPALQSDGNAAIPLFGLRGLPSGAVLALMLPMTADVSATSDADPGAAKIRWNHATQASATMLYIDDADGGGVPTDVAALLATLAVGGFVYLQGRGPAGAGVWQKWQVASITAASGYTKVGVTHVASAGSFAADAPIDLSLQQPNPSAIVDRSTVTALAIASGVVNIDWSLGDFFTLSLTANVTSITFSNLPTSGKGAAISVRIRQDATGSRTVALPSSFKAISGSDTVVQSAANAYTMLNLMSFDQGTRWEYSMKAGAA